jgi:hypothetical protein
MSRPALSRARGEVLRCRFCAWARPFWWRDARGRVRSGWIALAQHVADAADEETGNGRHPDLSETALEAIMLGGTHPERWVQS